MSAQTRRNDADSELRMIVAFVQPFMASKVVHALHQVKGLSGATFTDVRGFGRGRLADTAIPEVIAGTADRVRVDVVVPQALEQEVVDAIQRAAHTGNRGDGKIYVLTVARAVRISTGEEGAGAT